MDLKKNETTSPNFFEVSDQMIKFWQENKIFEKSVESRSEDNPYRFYDWPPFITWTPHYGHLLASTIKDIIPRYWTMKWKRVERVWGWDCHWIAVEEKVQKKLWINSNREIEEKGIENFIKECYVYTQEISSEWGWYIDHIGRWVDFENAYKTMDQKYMESVMWTFKQFYDKWLVYKGKRISLYSVKLGTPISNFEVAMDDSYADVNDPAVTVKFKYADGQWDWGNWYLLAWTTTPRTLPTNMALAVNKDATYVRVMYEDNLYIVAKNRVETVFKGKEYLINHELKWEALIGLSYEPIFPFYKWIADDKVNFKVYHADFITDTDWTWIWHEAPEFWEVDFQLWKQHGLYQTESIDDECKYNSQIPDYKWIYVRDANESIINRLKDEWKLFKKENITHRVAICPRTQIPLIYRTQDAWFLNVQSMKDKLLEQNQNINWFPSHLKDWRFAKNIETAPDWCLSRKRYWATPMPMWMGYDNEWNQKDIKVFWSVEEIESISGMKVTNIHRPYIDEITWKSNGLTYKRVSEVLDVWMESGSMSHAQYHYPFENKEKFEKGYPADFIVEYIGQVRAWFYVMHVVWVALSGQNAYKNVITTWVIAWNDGRKMSKSFGNFTDPRILLENYGGDAVRFYMVSTPIVKWEDMNFSDEWVKDILKRIILPFWNTYYFFSTYAQIDNFQPQYSSLEDIKNIKFENRLDRWILSALNVLIKDVEEGLVTYDLQKATRPVFDFIDNLTNWYIRRSRRRFWKSENDNDKNQGYIALYIVLVELSKVLAPFIPFVTEYIYKRLTEKESVHLEMYPTAIESMIDVELNSQMDKVQKIINLGLAWRNGRKIRVRQPLRSVTISERFDDYYQAIIAEELNVKEINVVEDLSNLCKKILKPNAKILWPKYWWAVQQIIMQAKEWNFEDLGDGKVKVLDYVLEPNEYEVWYLKTESAYDVEIGFDMVIAMDPNLDDELILEWYARDLVRFIQEARKEAGYNIEDKIHLEVNWSGDLLNKFGSYIESETLSTLTSLTSFDLEKEVEIWEWTMKFKLLRR